MRAAPPGTVPGCSGCSWVTGRRREDPHRHLAQSISLCLHPASLVFLSVLHTASSDVTPLHELPPTETSEFAARDRGSYLSTRVFVGSCLPTCRKLIWKRAYSLYFLCPVTHLAHGPAQSQLVVASSLPHTGLLSNASELSPLTHVLAVGGHRDPAGTVCCSDQNKKKNYFSRFLLLLSQQPFVCEPRAPSQIVGRAPSLSGQFPWLPPVCGAEAQVQESGFWVLSLPVKQNRERDFSRP